MSELGFIGLQHRLYILIPICYKISHLPLAKNLLSASNKVVSTIRTDYIIVASDEDDFIGLKEEFAEQSHFSFLILNVYLEYNNHGRMAILT